MHKSNVSDFKPRTTKIRNKFTRLLYSNDETCSKHVVTLSFQHKQFVLAEYIRVKCSSISLY